MTTSKNLGIWMDHSNAHLMEFTTDPNATSTMLSKFTHDENEFSLTKGENLMHNKEKHQQTAFYKKLSDVIINYDGVILFGPTDAKVALYHILKADHRFEKIKIDVKPTDKLTENQQHAFVKEHFTGHAS